MTCQQLRLHQQHLQRNLKHLRQWRLRLRLQLQRLKVKYQ
jgi:hypothetical protein